MSETERLIAEFIATRSRRRYSPATANFYRYTLRPFARTLPPGEDATMGSVENWLADSPSGETARSRLKALRAFYAWAGSRGLANATQDAQAPPRQTARTRVLTVGELRRVLAAAATSGRQDNALIALLLDTGIRIGEAAGLNTDQIDMDNAGGLALTVSGKTGWRRVPASAAAWRQIAPLMLPGQPLFRRWDQRRDLRSDGAALTSRALSARVRVIFERAGLSGPKLGPHALRHTFATMFLAAGGQLAVLQLLLGHTSIAMTMRYVALADSLTTAEHHRLSPLVLLAAPPAKEAQWTRSS